MITVDNFQKHVGQRFWKHIHNDTLIPYNGRIQTRKDFLAKLCSRIEKMAYVPSPPRGFVVSHKQNLVVRFIPTLDQADYCVYFFCIKLLEEEIAENRVPGTFGGWRLGGKLRKLENFDESPSTPDSAYNKYLWKQAWSEYQQKARNLSRNVLYRNYIIFDIANFYDSVRLRRLEILVRQATKKNKVDIVNLLFYFLSNWGKRDLNYDRQNIGLPQDEVGDCSRILANFYLQDYDKFVSELCKKFKSKYLRYSDDQIIASPNEETAKKIMFAASKELSKMGLNLNASKAKLVNNKEFFTYWSFDIFELLADPKKIENIQKAWILFQERKAAGAYFRKDTVLKRLLSCNLGGLPKVTRREILAETFEKDFITNVNEYYLNKIYRYLDQDGKKSFLKLINDLSKETLFNQFHLRVIKFGRKNHLRHKQVENVINSLAKLNKYQA